MDILGLQSEDSLTQTTHPKDLAHDHRRTLQRSRRKLLPHMAADLEVDPAITNPNHIDEIVFRRSEYLGGMAVAILAMIDQQN